MNGIHRDKHAELRTSLKRFQQDNGDLLGIQTEERLNCLCDQIISSIRRIEYVRGIQTRNITPNRIDPMSMSFDPIRGAILLIREGKLDEAVWLTFIQTHFGKHEKDGWKLAANIMSSFKTRPIWTFEKYKSHQTDFDQMLQNNKENLKDLKLAGRFSNHRKYESKKPEIISRTFKSFYEWQTSEGGFHDLIVSIHKKCGQEPKAAFDGFYRSMSTVSRFGKGRLGRFDFLTMLGKLNLAPIEPGSVYLDKASGPLLGANLLFFNNRDQIKKGLQLQRQVDHLDDYLFVGKQVIEDSLCNWQKSPDKFVYFRG